MVRWIELFKFRDYEAGGLDRAVRWLRSSLHRLIVRVDLIGRPPPARVGVARCREAEMSRRVISARLLSGDLLGCRLRVKMRNTR
jgi:hypothetical protein